MKVKGVLLSLLSSLVFLSVNDLGGVLVGLVVLEVLVEVVAEVAMLEVGGLLAGEVDDEATYWNNEGGWWVVEDGNGEGWLGGCGGLLKAQEGKKEARMDR